MARRKLTDEERRKSAERKKARKRAYYQEHKEEMRAYFREYIKAHPEKRNRYRATSSARKKIQGYNRQYYQAHKDVYKQRNLVWRTNNPEKVKEYNRRAQERRRQCRLEKQKKAETAKNSADLEKAKAMFKNPAMAAHLQWLADNRKKKETISQERK